MTAMEVGSLFLTMGVRDSLTPKLQEAKTEAQSLTDRLRGVGDGLGSAGGALTTLFAPAAAALGVAVNSSNQYATALTNIQAVTGASSGEIAALRSQLMSIGTASAAGPQAVAEAYYDVAGGVTDASARMATLQAAVSLSQAGNASLSGSTKALIGVMNSYQFSADQAGFASDVLTRSVGMGVGSMDEFASALPQVTGLAASLGIGFDDLGAMTSFLTTKGASASESVTQLGAMMSSVIGPNDTMKAALAELGFTSGEAAIESLGLLGVFDALRGTQTANSNSMLDLVGRVEALRGVTALTGPEVKGFLEDFAGGVAGATAAAEAIQMQGPAQQMALLQSAISGLGIEIGTALTPALLDITNNARPVILTITDWITKNPQLVSSIGTVIGVGAALGMGFMFLSSTLTAVVSVFTLFSGVAIGVPSLLMSIGSGALGIAPQILVAVAAIWAIKEAIVAVKSAWDTFNATVAPSAQAAQQSVATNLQQGNITRDDVYSASFNAIKAQFGNGAVGDILARLFYTNVANQAGANQIAIGPNFGLPMVPGGTTTQPNGGFQGWYANRENLPPAYTGPGWRPEQVAPQARASGGAVMKNQPYRVGEAGEELFVPDSSGEIIPNHRLGGITIQNMTINASSEEGGRAAARGFREELNMLMQATG